MNDYSMTIQEMLCYPQHEGKPNVVYKVRWVLVGTDGAHTACFTATTDIPPELNDDFIIYDNLSEEDVVKWVMTHTSDDLISAARAEIDRQIQNQINPPFVAPPLPWGGLTI